MINDLTQELSTNFIDYAYEVKRGDFYGKTY